MKDYMQCEKRKVLQLWLSRLKLSEVNLGNIIGVPLYRLRVFCIRNLRTSHSLYLLHIQNHQSHRRIKIIAKLTWFLANICILSPLRVSQKLSVRMFRGWNHQRIITVIPVSYTHLDVYKRQVYDNDRCCIN